MRHQPAQRPTDQLAEARAVQADERGEGVCLRSGSGRSKRQELGESQCFDVVFIDPPFAMAFVVETCQLLENKGWLSKHAKIYVEAERSLKLEGIPKNWQQLKNKVAGEVGYYLFERIG